MRYHNTFSEQRSWYESAHASLCLLGMHLRQCGFFDPLEAPRQDRTKGTQGYCQRNAMTSLFFRKSGEERRFFGLFQRRITMKEPKKASAWGKLIKRNEVVDNASQYSTPVDEGAHTDSSWEAPASSSLRALLSDRAR